MTIDIKDTRDLAHISARVRVTVQRGGTGGAA